MQPPLHERMWFLVRFQELWYIFNQMTNLHISIQWKNTDNTEGREERVHICLGQQFFIGGRLHWPGAAVLHPVLHLVLHRATPCYTLLHLGTPCYTPESKAQPIIPSPSHTSLSSSLLLSFMTGLEIQSLPHCWIEDSNSSCNTIFNPKTLFCISIQKTNIMFAMYCLLCAYLIFVASISSGASVKKITERNFFRQLTRKELLTVYLCTQCVISHIMYNFTDRV